MSHGPPLPKVASMVSIPSMPAPDMIPANGASAMGPLLSVPFREARG